MIHIVIGTKAQFIKMAPIIRRLSDKNINFNFIDLGQHSLVTQELRKEFHIREPDVCLSEGRNISTLFQGLVWVLKLFLKGLNKKWVKERIFLNKKGICLIHGDTVSTLLGLYFAKRARLKVAHIEAGLRSYNYFEPFPEEILRIIAMRYSDVLFAPSAWASDNLTKMNMGKKSILISANTSLEATRYSLDKELSLGLNLEKFSLVTVHRMENIFLKKKLDFIVELVCRISDVLPVVFIQHSPTINRLEEFRLQDKLYKIKNIHLFRIISHAHFIHLLRACEFVVTDGGSIQEESYYMGKPCLLLRNYTERTEGLNDNVVLAKFSLEKINYFLDNYRILKREESLAENISPSDKILDYLKTL
jgi:UDP-N-acetylglucosamine 2-epimerase